MPTLLQINATANWGSTGRIAEEIGKLVISQGWESYIAYGRYCNPSISKLIKVGCSLGVYEHYFEHKIFDNDGLASRKATIDLIRKINEITPDVIHLHNVHDHWLNYKLLFEYLNTVHIPIVWTQHDCWAFTGGCAYYTTQRCSNWQSECVKCSNKRTFLDRTNRQFVIKQSLFSENRNMHLVTVSKWLEQEVKKSFLAEHPIETIYNGIDLNVFTPSLKVDVIKNYKLENKKILLALATSWSKRKGFDDYLELSKILPRNYVILLVGLPENLKKKLSKNMIGIPRTSNIDELVSLYTCADVLLNLSYEETFGLTTVEAFACGTPVVVYNSTASPELVTPETGIVVEPGNIMEVFNAIEVIINRSKGDFQQSCRKWAEEMFDKNKTFENYISLYKRLLDR